MIQEERRSRYNDAEAIVIKRLKDHEYNRDAVANIPGEIEALKYQMEAIKATQYDKDRVSSYGNHSDEQKVDILTKICWYENRLRFLEIEVNQLEEALAKLTEKERKVLYDFYIDPYERSVNKLCVDLGYETAQVYRLKNAAFRKLSAMLVGIM